MNIFDQTGVNEQGLRPAMKKTVESVKHGSNLSLGHQRSLQQQQALLSQREKSEEKKVDFAFNVEKLKEEEFLNKLNSTVKRIDEYHVFTG